MWGAATVEALQGYMSDCRFKRLQADLSRPLISYYEAEQSVGFAFRNLGPQKGFRISEFMIFA
jgi:hypothetical protein